MRTPRALSTRSRSTTSRWRSAGGRSGASSRASCTTSRSSCSGTRRDRRTSSRRSTPGPTRGSRYERARPAAVEGSCAGFGRPGGGFVSQGPLDGIKVLDLTRLLPGAFATALLADLGADVLKVEQPGIGDPMRAYDPRVGDSSAFSWIADRNKRSIALNLRDPRGVEIIHRLARDADVVIEGFRPGVT